MASRGGFEVFADVFGTLGEFVRDIVRNEKAFFGVLLVAMTIIFGMVLRVALSKLSFFKGEGAHTLNKPGNVLCWISAIMSSLFLAWRVRGDVDKFISLFGGPSGEFFIWGIAIAIGYGVYRGLEGQRDHFRQMVGFGLALFTYGYLQMIIYDNPVYLLIMSALALLMFFISFFGRKKP